jgi:hypothetical protein
MVVTKGQRWTLTFGPRLYEVKNPFKKPQKYRKIMKIEVMSVSNKYLMKH